MLDVDALLKDYFQNTDEANDKPLMKAASSVLKILAKVLSAKPYCLNSRISVCVISGKAFFASKRFQRSTMAFSLHFPGQPSLFILSILVKTMKGS